MQAARRGVGVKLGLRVELVEDVLHAAHESAEALDGDGAVFDEGHGLGVACVRGQDTQPHLADVPDARLVLSGLGQHVGMQRQRPLFQRLGLVAAKLDD